MNPPKGIMSLTKPKQRVSARDSRAVDQVLDNTTQMLGKLDKKTLGLLLQLTQYIKANKPKYKELMANLEAKGALPPGVFPDEYDPKFLSVFALSVAKAQQAKNGMAAGGIAGIAQTMKDQGRGKDTMLAHISPEEAELLEKRGGVGTINPVTGLPEYGIFEDIGNALSGVGNAVGSVLKPVGDLIGGVLSSPLGMAATAAAAYYFMGPGAGAVVPSVAEAALPGALATEAAATALTPAAIEAGIGSAGYGYNASAAASGLFDPSVIGSGAAIGAPSTTDKLLSANLLKNVKLSSGEEEQSDPNALIKMLMMYEMMGSKQQQPSNVVVPALSETTSTLPYDTPKKPTYQQTRAAGGGLMTKNLGIGGLSANRTQTDYAKNYLPGSGYRPGQGGVTYFTPMNYGAGPATPVEPTPTPTPVDELVEQITGRPGGGGGRGDREPEDPNSFSAQWAAMSDAEKEAWRLENPIAAAAQDLAMLIGSPFAFAYQKIQELMGPDNSTGGPSRYTGPPETFNFGAPTYGGYPEGVTPNPYDMGPGTQAFTDARLAAAENARIAAENNARIDALIASLPDAQKVTPEDMGAVRNEKGEIDPRQAERTALNPFPTPLGSIVGEDNARNVGTYTPGQFRGAYLPEKLTQNNIDKMLSDVANTSSLTPSPEVTGYVSPDYGLGYQNTSGPFVNSLSEGFNGGVITTTPDYKMPANAEERAADLKDFGAYTNKFSLGDDPQSIANRSLTVAPKQYPGFLDSNTLLSTFPGAFESTIDSVTASDAANAEAQRVKDEAANKALMDGYTSDADGYTSDGLGSSYNLGPFTNSDLSGSPYNLGPFTAANTAATTAETISRINKSFEASEAANREAEAAAMERQTTLDRMARDAEAAEREAANQATLDADREAADNLERQLSVPLGLGTLAPAAPLGGVDLTGGISVPLGTGISTPSGPDLTGGIASLGGGFSPSDGGAPPSGFGQAARDAETSRSSPTATSGGPPVSSSTGNAPMGANAAPSDGGAPPSGGGGGGGGGRVICTHFYRKGEMSREMWRSDLEFTFKNLSPTTVRGYQYWAIPYVKLMRKSKLAENIMRPLAMHRAQELAYKMGRSPKGSLFGKVVRLIGEPICFTVGLFVGEQNWQSLWTPAKD